jgi:fibronectin-binding autotransporter adhesin
MKTKHLLCSLLVALPLASGYAQTLYWDGGTASITTNGTGVSLGAAGNWDNSTANWDQGAGLPFTAWIAGTNATFGAPGIAVGAGVVTLTAPITANTVSVLTTNYVFTDGGNAANTLTVENITNTQITTFSNNIINGDTFTKGGASTLTLLAASPQFSGNVNVAAGTLAFGSASVAAQTGPMGFGNVYIGTNATFKIQQDVNGSTYGQTISGPGSLSIAAATISDLVYLEGASTFTGSVTVNQAALAVTSIDDVNPCAIGNGTNVIIGASSSASALDFLGYGATTARAVTLGGTSANTQINNNGYGPLVWNGPVLFASANQHTLTLGGTATYLNIFGGVIGDNTTTNTVFEKGGTGLWMLTATNTYSGGTLVEGGTLIISNDFALGAPTGPITFTGGSYSLKSASNNVTLAATRTITVNSTYTANFGVLDSNNLTVASYITGAGAVIKASSSTTFGTVRFSNLTNSFAGDFSPGYGNTEFASVAAQGVPSSLGLGATATGGKITLANSTSFGTLRYVGANNSATTRPLSWTGTTGSFALDCTNTGSIAWLGTATLVNGAGTKTLTLTGSNTGTNTLAQIINDDGGSTALLKSGPGTWVLTGSNTFSGATTISGGMLALAANGSLTNSSSLTLDGGGTLNVSGLANGYALSSSQTFTVPSAVGAAVTGSLSVGSTSVAIAYTNGTPALTVSSGALTLSAASAVTLTIANGGVPLNPGNYEIIAAGAGGSVVGTAPTALTIAGDGVTSTDTPSLAIANGALYLQVPGATVYPPVLGGISATPGGIVLSFSGTNGQTYQVLTSTNLLTPIANWTSLTNGTLTGTPMTYTNTSTTNPAQFFIITSP